MDVKNVFAKNLSHYMAINGKTRRDICSVMGVSYSAVTAWINGKKYPRMDKVDELAKYFGISRADLVEEKITVEMDEEQDFVIDVLDRLYTDSDFSSYVKDIISLEPDKILVLKQMLTAVKVLAK